MLDYTKAAGEKILKDLQKIALVCNIVTQIFSIAYLIYALASGVGVFPVNLVALILSCAYFGFYLYNRTFGTKAVIKTVVTQIFKWSKRAVKLFNLAIAIYAIVFAAREPSALSVVFTVIMAFLWIADILCEMAIRLAKSWWHLFMTGIKADLEIITKPANAVGNFFKRMTGKEVEEKDDAPTKQREYLDKVVAENRTEKQNARMEKRLLKLQQAAKRRAEKQAKKAAKRNPVPTVIDETAITKDEL